MDAIEIAPLQTAQRDHCGLLHDEYRCSGTFPREIGLVRPFPFAVPAALATLEGDARHA
jgi:hypothetical protein